MTRSLDSLLLQARLKKCLTLAGSRARGPATETWLRALLLRHSRVRLLEGWEIDSVLGAPFYTRRYTQPGLQTAIGKEPTYSPSQRKDTTASNVMAANTKSFTASSKSRMASSKDGYLHRHHAMNLAGKTHANRIAESPKLPQPKYGFARSSATSQL